jgi:hypothetical protein
MDNSPDMQFYQLVLSLQAGAMQQMGKIASPLSGQVERDLEMARSTIDLLEMLERKTKGNLNADEKNVLDHVLFELRLNFIDEQDKDKTGAAETQGGSEKPVKPESPDAENVKNG